MKSLTALAEEALEHAKALDAYLAFQGLPSTSFEVDSLTTLLLHLSEHRDGLINSSQTLKQLAQGPATILSELGWTCTNEISLGAIYDYQLAKAVPLDGSATLQRLRGQADNFPRISSSDCSAMRWATTSSRRTHWGQ